MKKGCLIAILGVVGLFVVLIVASVVWALMNPTALEEGTKSEPVTHVTEPDKEEAEKVAKIKTKPPAKTPIADLYSVIKDTELKTVKRSVDVRLKEKVSESALKEIANKIRNSSGKKFQRTFIVYYLPEQEVDAGGWATSHFDPALEVKILGLSEKVASNAKDTIKGNEHEIGTWEYLSPPSYVVIILKTEKGIVVREIYGDESSKDESMTASLVADQIFIRPVKKNSHGEYWILDADKNLRLMDSQGLIGKAVAKSSGKDFDQFKEALGIKEGEESPNAATIFDERQWTSADGQRTFVGKLTKLGDGKMTVEKEGRPITFSIDKLSTADRAFLGQGITLTTMDGVTRENGSVTRISADSISFKNPSGLATITMENLPQEMRQRFGYDPKIAAEMRKAKEKYLAVMKSRKEEANAQRSAQQKLDTFMAVLKNAGIGNDLVTNVSTRGETISITVATIWHYQPKQVRQQSAQLLWQTWAMISSPSNLDHARLKLVDAVGNEVGGSRFLAGSLIWVKD